MGPGAKRGPAHSRNVSVAVGAADALGPHECVYIVTTNPRLPSEAIFQANAAALRSARHGNCCAQSSERSRQRVCPRLSCRHRECSQLRGSTPRQTILPAPAYSLSKSANVFRSVSQSCASAGHASAGKLSALCSGISASTRECGAVRSPSSSSHGRPARQSNEEIP